VSGRLLPAALLVAIACAVAILVALPGENRESSSSRSDGATSSAARLLMQVAGGPSGSAPVTLHRWRYRPDPDGSGTSKGWASGDWKGRIVRVPYCPNATAFSGAAGRRAHAGSIGWFATDVTAPVRGRYAVRVQSAHHRAAVFVGGRLVRAHVGAYEPFSARMLLSRGRHTIVVRVDWRDPAGQAASGWARAWFNYGGLNRPVTLTRLARSELAALSVRTRLLGRRRARIDVSVRVHNRGDRRPIRLRGSLSGGTRAASPLSFPVADVGAGRSRTLRASVELDDAALWSPASPARYALRVGVPAEATLKRMVGLRQITWGAKGLALNGRRLVLRGAGMPPDARGHGDALTAADEAGIVGALQRLRANATRAQMPLSESMLERLDAAGILVWQEIGPWEPAGQWRAVTPEQIAAARDRALRTADAQRSYASIVAWTLANEISGQGRPGQREYVVQTAERLHARDPTRPVAADLWGSMLPSSAGPLFAQLDAIGVTDYVGWYEALDRHAAGQQALTDERIAGLRAVFPDKPIVVTELGAGGSARIGGGRFGGLRHQAVLLARRVAALRDERALSGTLIWNLRDYALRPDFRGGSVLDARPGLRLTPGLNEKGLFDFGGRAKPSLSAVRRAFGE
jgi:hypothetical protein